MINQMTYAQSNFTIIDSYEIYSSFQHV